MVKDTVHDYLRQLEKHLPCPRTIREPFLRQLEDELDNVSLGKTSYSDCLRPAHERLMRELASFKEKRLVSCPECGDRDNFFHNVNTDKGWNYWKCKACGSAFEDADGRPGSKKEKREIPLSDFDCLACGKAKLCRFRGVKNGTAYDFFKCSDQKCAAIFNVADDKPVLREIAKLSDFPCKKCGKPLAIRPTQKGGIYFSCSGYPHCKQRYWATRDETPDYDAPPESKMKN